MSSALQGTASSSSAIYSRATVEADAKTISHKRKREADSRAATVTACAIASQTAVAFASAAVLANNKRNRFSNALVAQSTAEKALSTTEKVFLNHDLITHIASFLGLIQIQPMKQWWQKIIALNGYPYDPNFFQSHKTFHMLPDLLSITNLCRKTRELSFLIRSRQIEIIFETVALTLRPNRIFLKATPYIGTSMPKIEYFKFLFKFSSRAQKIIFLEKAFALTLTSLKEINDREIAQGNEDITPIEIDLTKFFDYLLVQFRQLDYPVGVCRAVILADGLNSMIEWRKRLLDFMNAHMNEDQKAELIKKLFSKEPLSPKQPLCTFLYNALTGDHLVAIDHFSTLHPVAFAEVVTGQAISYRFVIGQFEYKIQKCFDSNVRKQFVARLLSQGVNIYIDKWLMNQLEKIKKSLPAQGFNPAKNQIITSTT
jgi:hypothetical protein